MSDSSFKTMLIAGIGAAGAAAVLCYLMKDEPPKKPQASVSKATPPAGVKLKVNEFTTEAVQQILKEIVESQEQMKGHMKEVTKELRTKNISFDETYDRILGMQPTDPLEKHQITMEEFDQLLDKHQSDPLVREAIAKIMGSPNISCTQSEKVQGITVKKIIEIHNVMLKELEDLAETHKQRTASGHKRDDKTVTIVAQAVVGAKIETMFDVTPEDIESAVSLHHAQLATNQEFATINLKIQHTMGKLMGAGA